MSKELIRLRDLCMAFDDEVVLDNLNLYINDKEFLTLLGPSGCGKTTTLRIIGGFTTPTSGDVLFDGVRINDVPPYKRQINTVFQKYALFPHLNVFENVAFGLRLKKVPDAEIKERVMEMLEVVSLKGFEKPQARRPLRRPAAAGGHRPGPGEPAQGAAAGRAPGRPGPEAAQGHADRAQAHPAAGGHHLYLCHPRSGGGPHHVRHHRGHGQGLHPADRHPRGHLQRAEKRLCGGLHRRVQHHRRHHGPGQGGEDVRQGVPLPGRRLCRQTSRWTWSSARRTSTSSPWSRAS